MIRSIYFENSVSRETFQKINKYHEFLIENNQKLSLISKKSEEIAVKRHYEDCAQIIKYLDNNDKKILDIGSGAGLPGIPLAIMNPDKYFFLLDSNGKKTRFLFNVRLKLGLKNCFEIHERVENYKPEKGFDMVLTRAFSPLSSMLLHCDHLLSDGGLFCAMKGRLSTLETHLIPSGYKIIKSEQLIVPTVVGDRYLIKIAKESSSFGA